MCLLPICAVGVDWPSELVETSKAKEGRPKPEESENEKNLYVFGLCVRSSCTGRVAVLLHIKSRVALLKVSTKARNGKLFAHPHGVQGQRLVQRRR